MKSTSNRVVTHNRNFCVRALVHASTYPDSEQCRASVDSRAGQERRALREQKRPELSMQASSCNMLDEGHT